MASQPPRRRLPAAEARLRILDAAERSLAEAGPEGLRLAELAQELGVSHPAILHHFGSREDLVHAVVKRAMSALSEDLMAIFTANVSHPESMRAEPLLHRIAETLADRGQGRLIAWLMLSGQEPPELGSAVQLNKLSAVAHALHQAKAGTVPIDPADSSFLVQLTCLVVLAEAVFGERVRKLEGIEEQPEASHDFRVRLAKLLELQLDHLSKGKPSQS